MNNAKIADNVLRRLGKIFLIIGASWLTKIMVLLSLKYWGLILIELIMLVVLFLMLVNQGIKCIQNIMELK